MCLAELQSVELQQGVLLFQVDCLQDALEGAEEALSETKREAHQISMVRTPTCFSKWTCRRMGLFHTFTPQHFWSQMDVFGCAKKKNIIMMMFLVIKPWRFRLGEGQGWEHEGFVVGIPDLTRSWNDMLMHVYNFATVSFHYSHQHKQKLKLKSSQCRPQDTFVSLLVALAFSHSPCQVGYFLIDNILDKFFFQKKKNSSKAVRTCTRQPLH